MAKTALKKESKMKDVRICVLHRGWVLVGQYDRVGDFINLTNNHVIRRWGTTSGLGQIALGGPTSSTLLDKEPECEFHISQCIRTIKCEGSKWEKHLS
jgi:hypothetical protein